MNGNGLPGLGALRNIEADPVLDVQLPTFLQDQDCHGGKLLGHRAEAEIGLRRIWNVSIAICKAVCVLKNAAMLRDKHRSGQVTALG